MIYTIISIKHTSGEPSLHQGIKKQDLKKFSKNHHIIGGSNGSYITLSQAVTNLSIRNQNGNISNIDIYRDLKELTDNRKFTKKFINELNQNLSGMTFEVKAGDDLKKVIYNFLRNKV